MRICTDNRDDPHFDNRPRRVWSRDAEVVVPWSIADEFRRVVILTDGRVLHGAVFIERLKEDGTSQDVFAPPTPNAGFSGTLASVPDAPAAQITSSPVVPAAAAAPAAAHFGQQNRKHNKRR